MKSHTALILVLLAAAANGGPRVSTDYTVPADSLDGGGQRTTSSAYTNDGSLGGITGLSTASTPAVTVKSGYLGQLTEVTALQLAATPTTVEEAGTRQLSAAQLLDDDSLVALAATDVAWSVASGPLSGIDANGLATASTVYEDTAATAQGDYAGATGTLGLTVLNSDPDNFGTYAGDGIDDDWQVGFFGFDNPDAGPGENPDGDPNDNTMEFLSGFDPTDAAEFFQMTIDGFSAATTVDLQLNKVIPGRTYTISASPDLVTPFAPVGAPFSVGSEESDKLFQDTGAGATKKFYTVEIEKP